MQRNSIVGVVLVVVAAGLFWFARTERPPIVGEVPGSASEPGTRASTPELAPVTSAAERMQAGAAELGPASDSASAEWDDAGLLLRLRATAQAFLAHDEGRLTSELEALLASSRVPRRVIGLVEDGRAAPGSLESEGALLCLGFATALEARGRALALDGRAFRAEYLDALARFDSAVGEPFAEFAARLRVSGRPCIGHEWIGVLERLRRERPEHAATFDPFLAALVESSLEGDTAESHVGEFARIVSTSNDAAAVEAALSVLLATRPDEFLPEAERLFADSQQAGDLRQAVVTAVARHAPVEAGSDLLARIAREDQYGAFLEFGARPGALDAAARRYSDLVASDSDSRARKMFVASMGAERTDVLIGIARTETSAEVRGQALLTATLRPVESRAVGETLRELHAARPRGGESAHGARASESQGLSTRSALPVAENLLRNGRGAAREDAAEFLRAIVADASEDPADRRSAWERLRNHLGPEELVGVVPPP